MLRPCSHHTGSIFAQERSCSGSSVNTFGAERGPIPERYERRVETERESVRSARQARPRDLGEHEVEVSVQVVARGAPLGSLLFNFKNFWIFLNLGRILKEYYLR